MSDTLQPDPCAKCGAIVNDDPVQIIVCRSADVLTGLDILQDEVDQAAPLGPERAEIFSHIDWFISQIRRNTDAVLAAGNALALKRGGL